MENLKAAFDVLDDGSNIPVGHDKASGHLVFDICMKIERKSRWVEDGHKNHKPEYCVFSGVVSRESVRIKLTHYDLNDFPICACDVQNAYLKDPSSENTMFHVVQSLD